MSMTERERAEHLSAYVDALNAGKAPDPDTWLQRRGVSEDEALRDCMVAAVTCDLFRRAKPMSIYEHVARFARKCGGRSKLTEGRRALASITDDFPGYVRRVGKSEAGAKQLVASALLGYVLAELIMDSVEHGDAPMSLPSGRGI